MLQPGALATFVAGLAFGLSLIVAIGAQNSFVLRQGALRAYVATVVVICSLSDVVLIVLGVAGAGAALSAHPALVVPARIGGAAFLFAYALLAARRAARPVPIETEPARTRSAWFEVVGACLAFTWLNPAVYLDTVVLLGSVADSQRGIEWWFGSGAALASVLWFIALGYGARLLARPLQSPGAWRILDAFVAAVMTATALRIVLAT